VFALALTQPIVLASARMAAPEATPEYRTDEWWRAARRLMIVSLSQLVLSQQTDVLVVGKYVGVAQAGVYGVASQFASLITFGVSSVSYLGAPMMADLYARGDMHGLERLTKWYGRLNLLVSIPALLLLVGAGSLSLGWFGPGFVAGYPILLILSIAQVANAMVGVQGGFLLTMTGRERAASYIIGASAVVNLLLYVVFTPLFGAEGTALATALATVARGAALYFYIRRELRLNIVPW